MAKEFDLCLCHANYGYAGCRNFNQIAPAKLLCLKEGAFVRYKDMQASKGYEMSQSKPIRVLFDHESQGFFQMEVQGQGEEKAHEKGR